MTVGMQTKLFSPFFFSFQIQTQTINNNSFLKTAAAVTRVLLANIKSDDYKNGFRNKIEITKLYAQISNMQQKISCPNLIAFFCVKFHKFLKK